MKQLCCECDLHEAVLRLGLSHPKLRSATASLAWCYRSGASTRLFLVLSNDKPYLYGVILSAYE